MANGIFPPRNLGAAENWGRNVEQEIKRLRDQVSSLDSQTSSTSRAAGAAVNRVTNLEAVTGRVDQRVTETEDFLAGPIPLDRLEIGATNPLIIHGSDFADGLSRWTVSAGSNVLDYDVTPGTDGERDYVRIEVTEFTPEGDDPETDDDNSVFLRSEPVPIDFYGDAEVTVASMTSKFETFTPSNPEQSAAYVGAAAEFLDSSGNVITTSVPVSDWALNEEIVDWYESQTPSINNVTPAVTQVRVVITYWSMPSSAGIQAAYVDEVGIGLASEATFMNQGRLFTQRIEVADLYADFANIGTLTTNEAITTRGTFTARQDNEGLDDRDVNISPTQIEWRSYGDNPAPEASFGPEDVLRWQNNEAVEINAFDWGVKMDSATDDTAAWQALLDAAPRGATIRLPASPSGAQWSLITDTLTITTDSLRIVGPSSYMYNGGFVFEGVNKPMFVIKSAGVQFEYVSVIGRSSLGQDPTYGMQVGMEFFGTPAGDIDSRMSHCSFLNMGQAIITRGRNLTVEQSLFGTCAVVWNQLPKDASYHDMGEPNIVRGNIFRHNRIHGCGRDGWPVIRIAEHTDYRHGSVESSYFDNNCMGWAVAAVGASGAPVRGLRIVDNIVVEQTAGGVFLEYTDTVEVITNKFLGTGSATYSFDAIRLNNSPGAFVEGNSVSRPGRHGISISNSETCSILSNRVSLAGPAATGDGVHVDANSSGVRISGLTVEGATGYGVTCESPGAMDSVKLRTTAGALNSSTLVMPTSSLSGNALTPITGSPSVGVRSNYPVLLMDAGVTSQAGGFLAPPAGAQWVAVEVVFCTTTSGSGNVQIQLGRTMPTDGSIGEGNGVIVVPVSVSGSDQVFRARTLVQTPVSGGVLGVRVARLGTQAADTYSGAIGIMSLNLVQTL